MIYYAQLNNEKICVGVSQLSGKVEDPFLVEIEPTDYPMGKRFDGEKWVEVEEKKPKQPEIPEPTEKELLLSIMDAITDIQMGGGEL